MSYDKHRYIDNVFVYTHVRRFMYLVCMMERNINREEFDTRENSMSNMNCYYFSSSGFYYELVSH